MSIPWSTKNKPESTSSRSKPPASPSPSASVILVSPINKVLLLHRVQTSSSFPSAHVFPGGNLESSDGDLPAGDSNPARHEDNEAYRIGAIRELFEETGILLARESSESDAPLLSLPSTTRQEGRKAIHSNKIQLSTWLSQQSITAVLDTSKLIPFTRWVTPTNVPKRFTTQMYIYFLPLSAGDDSSLTATSDEVETMAPEWMYPYEWLGRARSGEIILFPPQFLLLFFVSEYLDPSVYDSTITESEHMSSDELEWRRKKLVQFITHVPPATSSSPDSSRGNSANVRQTNPAPPLAWRDKVISPTALSFARKDGRTILGLDKPGPELKDSYPHAVRGDDSHVVLVRFSKAGPREVEVQRKKDVLDELRREKELVEREEREQAEREERENKQKAAAAAAAEKKDEESQDQTEEVQRGGPKNEDVKSKL